MESPPFLCMCGRSFDYQNAFSNHTRACAKKRRNISESLLKAREIWVEKQKSGRKRLRVSTHDEIPVIQSPRSREDTPESADEVDIPQDLHLSIAARRPTRKKDLPSRFHDMLPSASIGWKTRSKTQNSGEDVTSNDHVPAPQPESNQLSSNNQRPNAPFYTAKNSFNLFRGYLAKPTHDPDGELVPKDLVDLLEVEASPSSIPTEASDDDALRDLAPYPNKSAFMLGEWFWASKSKTLRDFKSLLDIITSQVFSIDDIRDTPWNQINQVLGASTEDEAQNALFNDAGWRKEEVVINLPFNTAAITPGPKKYLVGEFYCRSIIAILRERLSGDESRHFHYEPFELFWKPKSDQPSQRIYGELYSSQAFIEQHREIQALPPEPNCDLPRVVAALMFASDETHLTQFGNTTVHPLYLYFGNFSKYLRAKPSKRLCNHVAYFIKLPKGFKDFYRSENGGRPPTESIASHSFRETLHAQWRSIMDDEFMDAYEHGVVIKCGFDRQERRFYPRIFTLSADYNEKVTICGIRHMGDYPCPRCLIPIEEIENLGMPSDRVWRTKKARVDDRQYRWKIQRAQDLIYKENLAVKNARVESHLFPQSLVPSQNAFSQRLSAHGFNIFGAMVVDCLHEIEGGSWEALYTHLLRILECVGVGDHLTTELDTRYRETPTFGCDAIRKFRRSSSQMGYMAIREWENLLQCAIPAFEGLLPEPHNSEILDLLYVFASWHGFAKLRQHTEDTLDHLERLTKDLGSHLRNFKLKTCAKHDTRELAREVAARIRLRRSQAKRRAEIVRPSKFPPEARSESRIDDSSEALDDSSEALDESSEASVERGQTIDSEDASPDDTNLRSKGKNTAQEDDSVNQSAKAKSVKFSLRTYKLHAMGDYVNNIRRFGTVDSYSTESGELEHRTPKSYYSRTSKKDFITQMTSIERQKARIHRIREAMGNPGPDELLKTDGLQERYIIGKSEKASFHIGHFLQQNSGDPAVKGFYSDLRAHLLARVQDHFGSGSMSPEFDEQVTDSDFFIQRDRIYTHKTIRLNYTTSDVRRAQDLINPNTAQCNVMMLAAQDQEEEEATAHASSRTPLPFAYARVLAIYHVNVVLTSGDPKPRRFDILWVRWYQQEENTPSLRLPKLHLPPIRIQDCAFVDPANVIRACHIIPAFAEGRRYTMDTRGSSALGKDREDWKSYYLSQFADRDLLMRAYWGWGVGHIHATDQTEKQRPCEGTPCGEAPNPPISEHDISRPITTGLEDEAEAYEDNIAAFDEGLVTEVDGREDDDDGLDDEQFAQKYALYEA